MMMVFIVYQNLRLLEEFFFFLAQRIGFLSIHSFILRIELF